MELPNLGWTPFFASAFAPHAAAGLEPARVCAEHKGGLMVLGTRGECPARISGRLRHHAKEAADYPAVGDWVAVKPPAGADDPARIHAILPRRTKFSRTAAGEKPVEQILATNIDAVFVMASLTVELNLRRLERFLALSRESGAQPVVVLTKRDLCPEFAARVEQTRAAAGDAPVLAVSHVSGDGLAELQPYLLPGRTVALLGMSGVGKSTFVNVCLGDELMATDEVRESDQKGRHTTTARHLIPLPSGALLLDTPGMRELQLWEGETGVGETFADIDLLAAGCRFNDCRHTTEPGCAVRVALEGGTLDAGRFASYLKLAHEARLAARRHDRVALEDTRVRWNTANKGAKTAGKSTSK